MDVLIIIREERDPCNRSVHLNGELIRQRVGFRGMFISPVTFQVSLCAHLRCPLNHCQFHLSALAPLSMSFYD